VKQSDQLTRLELKLVLHGRNEIKLDTMNGGVLGTTSSRDGSSTRSLHGGVGGFRHGEFGASRAWGADARQLLGKVEMFWGVLTSGCFARETTSGSGCGNGSPSRCNDCATGLHNLNRWCPSGVNGVDRLGVASEWVGGVMLAGAGRWSLPGALWGKLVSVVRGGHCEIVATAGSSLTEVGEELGDGTKTETRGGGCGPGSACAGVSGAGKGGVMCGGFLVFDALMVLLLLALADAEEEE
jgi:hypothetical protein